LENFVRRLIALRIDYYMLKLANWPDLEKNLFQESTRLNLPRPRGMRPVAAGLKNGMNHELDSFLKDLFFSKSN